MAHPTLRQRTGEALTLSHIRNDYLRRAMILTIPLALVIEFGWTVGKAAVGFVVEIPQSVAMSAKALWFGQYDGAPRIKW